MKHRLAYRLAVTYGIIFIMAIVIIDSALVFVYRENQLRKNESFYIGFCGMLSAMAENNIKITNYINANGGLTDQSNGRVLLLDIKGKILLDSGGELTGTSITNPEFRRTVGNGKPATGYYTFDKKGMAMFSYPVFLSGQLSAVILVSVSIQDIYNDINRFAFQIIIISAVIIALVIGASILMGRRLSEPITSLTNAVDRIYSGDISTTVEISRNDEIGVLAGAFNKMSSELQKVEVGRRRFISDVSHELKTPLASIKALIEALIDTGRDMEENEHTEYLQDVDHEIDRLNNLVGSLITATRLEEMNLKLELLPLGVEVANVLKVLQPLAANKRISLYNLCDEPVVIKADRDMFREVLINLIGNSIKYGSYDGYVRIESDNVSFKVVDNGCGIPEEDLPYIFDSFYRVDRSRTGESGSGIGLFVVKRILELHGFDIAVSSKLGEGTIFVIKFNQNL